jgi:probable addiction module antidote protein
MGKLKTTRYDVADYLKTPEDRAGYLEAVIEECEGDPAYIALALGNIARSKGMTNVARETGLSRESLYKALSGNRSPEFGTILKVMAALGLHFHVVAK